MGMLVFLEAQDMEKASDIPRIVHPLMTQLPKDWVPGTTTTTSSGSSWLYNPLDPKNPWKNEGLLHPQNMG